MVRRFGCCPVNFSLFSCRNFTLIPSVHAFEQYVGWCGDFSRYSSDRCVSHTLSLILYCSGQEPAYLNWSGCLMQPCLQGEAHTPKYSQPRVLHMHEYRMKCQTTHSHLPLISAYVCIYIQEHMHALLMYCGCVPNACGLAKAYHAPFL